MNYSFRIQKKITLTLAIALLGFLSLVSDIASAEDLSHSETSSRAVFNYSVPDCTLLSSKKKMLNLEEGVHPLWGQDLIGSDLAREIVRDSNGSSRVPVAIIDESFYPQNTLGLQDKYKDNYDLKEVEFSKSGLAKDHGTRAANLLSSPSDVSISEKTDLIAAFNSKGRGFSGNIPLMEKTSPKAISISLQMFPKDKDDLLSLAEKHLLVVSAGNEFPKEVSKLKQELPVIRVGSLSTWGAVASYSSQSEKVDVLAPSGYGVGSFGFGGDSALGGTSGATPVAAGAIANIFSFIPQLSKEQVRLLIKSTAIAIPWLRQQPQKNGAGLINAYKLVRVAEKLKNTPAEKIDSVLNNKELFDFSEEAKSNLETAEKLLEQARKAGYPTGCGVQTKAYNLLRKSFLLSDKMNSQNEKTYLRSAALLSALLRENGWIIQSDFYRSLDERKLAELIKEYLSKENPENQLEALRFSELIGYPKSYLKQAMQSAQIVQREISDPIGVAQHAASLAFKSQYYEILLDEINKGNNFVFNFIRDNPELFATRPSLVKAFLESSAADWRKKRFLKDISGNGK